ncbi:aminotransferase class IV [Lentzea aerocolonigenes]|uniref:aminotransferase class IV n=1 Tax=Lentzea aerocolonigenes TaxID=68170 RepID=UPI0006893B96|nr:aminotransferase class IV [Lentzea aerocolonigenes]MCP2241793.1 Branched-chain amino acid aminotransferase/4-amino-4-deoxychorismate lyase [Lentzea aerocolonigenes]
MTTEDTPLLVADSWLVLDGSVRSLDRHVRRFTRSCLEIGAVTPEQLDGFWRETISVLPRTGAWFPRVELAGDPATLRLRIRPAPPRGEHVRVWVPDVPDHRRSPARKGPDLQSLTALRAEAEKHGAQEALLRTADGVVVEAASSSVLWWEDDVLCSPPEEIPALPGTTAGLVLDLAASLEVRTARRARHVDELAGREVWLLNALHGIRLVSELIGCDAAPGSGTRFTSWRERVERLRTPLDPPPSGL